MNQRRLTRRECLGTLTAAAALSPRRIVGGADPWPATPSRCAARS